MFVFFRSIWLKYLTLFSESSQFLNVVFTSFNRIDDYGTENAFIADKSAASASARFKALVLLLLTHCSLGLPLFVGLLMVVLFCCVVLSVLSSIAIILFGFTLPFFLIACDC